MRHGLLLTAVATVTLPGLLAILAVVGHEHVAAERGASAAAVHEAPLSGPVSTAPQAARAAVPDNAASGERAPVSVLYRVTASQQAKGMRLLDSAAAADRSTSYQGTELTSQSGVDGSVKTISQVWHQGGGRTLVETSSGTSSTAARPAAYSDVASADPVSNSPEGVFGVTKSLVALLGEHYVAVYQGGASVAGRSAMVVELLRFDGSLAARYWLDDQTSVPLRRELYDTSDKVISEDSFVQVKFGALAPSRPAAAAAPPSPAATQPDWVKVSPAPFVTALAGRGWQVPSSLPGGLPLYGASWTKTASGEVADLEYSDGLYVASLFVQRGTLAPGMAGWRSVSVDGQQAFVSGHSVTWARLGFVYTMIADAPPQTVTQVVGALPSTGSPGVLDRLGRGFIRIARVINPFS